MQSGQVIRDLVLEERIGAGGVGEVWKARHRHLDKVVAIKAIYSHLDQDPQFFERFRHEAVAMARLEHRHIVAIHDFFFDDGNSYLVMSYVEGESLQDIILQRAPLPVDEALNYALQILDALNFAHRQGVVHRDVKPSNILVRNKQAFLVDFGIALVLGKERVTQFGTNIGTPEYMSPEQIKASDIDERSDVYSFGCVLYEMLTSRPPFGSQDVDGLAEFDILDGHINKKPPSIRQINSAVDSKTEAVVKRALEKDPERRYRDCKQMGDALRRKSSQPTAPLLNDNKYMKASLALTAALAVAMAYPTYSWFSQPIDLDQDAAELRQRIRELERRNKDLSDEKAQRQSAVAQSPAYEQLMANFQSLDSELNDKERVMKSLCIERLTDQRYTNVPRGAWSLNQFCQCASRYGIQLQRCTNANL